MGWGDIDRPLWRASWGKNKENGEVPRWTRFVQVLWFPRCPLFPPPSPPCLSSSCLGPEKPELCSAQWFAICMILDNLPHLLTLSCLVLPPSVLISPTDVAIKIHDSLTVKSLFYFAVILVLTSFWQTVMVLPFTEWINKINEKCLWDANTTFPSEVSIDFRKPARLELSADTWLGLTSSPCLA